MMRAPMSRMDVLTDGELSSLLSDSKLVRKYNEDIDRNSAYEILTKKIEDADAEEARIKAKEEKEALKKEESKRRTTTTRRRSTSRRSTRQHPLVKVLTSPTVIRSVLGILTKMIK